jgi:hypothetical protein
MKGEKTPGVLAQVLHATRPRTEAANATKLDLPGPLTPRDQRSEQAQAAHARMRRVLMQRRRLLDEERLWPAIRFMEPGRWYLPHEVQAATGIAVRHWFEMGDFIERRPATRGAPTFYQPKHEYGLTPRGERLRRLLCLLD